MKILGEVRDCVAKQNSNSYLACENIMREIPEEGRESAVEGLEEMRRYKKKGERRYSPEDDMQSSQPK
tara:strand:+ start:400 stop:603 length:204 start_codon:yes stop_codon:yes gene_type:complete